MWGRKTQRLAARSLSPGNQEIFRSNLPISIKKCILLGSWNNLNKIMKMAVHPFQNFYTKCSLKIEQGMRAMGSCPFSVTCLLQGNIFSLYQLEKWRRKEKVCHYITITYLLANHDTCKKNTFLHSTAYFNGYIHWQSTKQWKCLMFWTHSSFIMRMMYHKGRPCCMCQLI